jgi:hypothetical protein
VDADHPQRLVVRRLEAVRHLRGNDHHVPAAHDQLVVADRERGRAGLDDEDLRVRVKVQGRALSPLVLSDEDRNPELVATFEQRRRRAVSQIFE